jgi:tRNA(Ser,Leu) C12 N-acetylase TAN1|tara:strand:- start:127 stop:375 length:249 start_codon:yes stop_codon:yes gene_type:complete
MSDQSEETKHMPKYAIKITAKWYGVVVADNENDAEEQALDRFHDEYEIIEAIVKEKITDGSELTNLEKRAIEHFPKKTGYIR